MRWVGVGVDRGGLRWGSDVYIHTYTMVHTVRFLISPLAGFITGEIIDQNGGYHMD